MFRLEKNVARLFKYKSNVRPGDKIFAEELRNID